MRHMGICWKLAGSALLALLAAGGVFYCVADDPHSTKGFAILLVFFCIQVLIMPFDADAADNMSVWEHLWHGINKAAAMVALIVFASPHPQFTGVLLWLGISALFLSSGANNFSNVAAFTIAEVKSYRRQKAQIKQRIQEEIQITSSMKADEFRRVQEKQTEDDLLSDLSDFLNGDSSRA